MELQKLLILLLVVSIGISLNAQQWTKSDLSERSSIDNDYLPEKYKGYQLEFPSLMTELEKAKTSESRIELPTPDGGMEMFMIEAADVFHPDLAAKYPGIKAYKGYSLDVPGSYIRMGYGASRLHAMILREGAQTTYIDYIKGSEQKYAVYYRNDYGFRARHQFECLVNEDSRDIEDVEIATTRHGDCELRKYRLALACTGEYASFHGGTVESVLVEYNVAMARVNGLYERDAGITMELIANTDEVIFLDGSTDPYTNNSGGAMLAENQNTCDDIIGSVNYDIGHVFSTGGGGVANLRSPCNNNSKARGVTGLGSPINDPFYIDYVAHEMGHQFGGNHSYNNSCGGNRNNSTAVEPGSGSTIMAYAGICSPNVQSNSDDHFHGVNLIEIANFVTGNGNSCAEIIPTTNNAPGVTVANAVVTIPARTTFFLNADATDTDGDMMTYCWEQMDIEIANMPPQGINTGGPMFRSNSPNTDSRRFFPRRIGESTWEVLPTVTREMNFMCTVRDNNSSVGCTGEVNVEVNVFDTGSPFRVTAPNTDVVWPASDIKEVTWDVSGTDSAPINSTLVDIFLSIDGGETFDIVLAEDASNDGSHEVVVPDIPTDMARVVIVGNDNVFYDMSDDNFSITAEFSVDITPFSQVACGQDELVYTANLMSAAAFDDVVSLSVSNLPDGAIATLSENTITTPASVDVTITGLLDAEAGSYLSTFTAMAENTTINEIFAINIQNDDLQITNTTTPADESTDVDPVSVDFSWDAQEGVSFYQFQLSTAPDFVSAPVTSATPTSSTVTRTDFEEGTIYYWRVRARSICSTGKYSETKAFRTASDGCVQYVNDTPVEIEADDVGEVESILEVPMDIDFSQAKVTLDISHTFTGDLSAEIASPTNVSFDLFDRPGVPASDYGCPRDDIMATFSNDAVFTAIEFEGTCDSEPAIAGEFQAMDPFTSTPSMGTWTLTVADDFPQDGGFVNSWSIEVCTDVVFPDVITGGTKNIIVINGGSAPFDNTVLTVESDDSVTIYITKLPNEGTLMRGMDEIVEGSSVTEEELANGTVTYVHSGNEAIADGFKVDVQVPSTGAWLRNEYININILDNTFQVVASVPNQVSCFGGSDGTIFATAVEGLEPYQFSIDNVNFQNDPTFDGLSAGDYTVYVKDADDVESVSNPITLTQPDEIILTISLVGYAINASAEGGVGGFEYSIDGINFNATGIFPDLDNGDYDVIVRDANDCTASGMFVVNIETLSALISIVDLVCANVEDGSIIVVPAGGIEPYEYSLNESVFVSDNTFADLPVGTYSISVKDAGGKVVVYDNVMLLSALPISYSYTIDMGDLVIDAMGGTEPYMYSTNGIDFQSENVLDIDLTQDYTLTISDAVGCIYVFDLSISLVTSILVTTLDVCFSENNGSIIVNGITGGLGPYQYSINDGPFQDEAVFGNLSSSSYDITVRDANGSEYTEVGIPINENPEIELDHFISSDTLYVIGIGGAGSGYSYSINGEGFNMDGFFTDLPDGDYTVIVMDASGCVESFLIMFTDVDDVLVDSEIKIYPNPVSEILQVELLDLTNRVNKISLIGIDGKIVLNLRQLTISNLQTVDVSRLSNGLYVLYVETEKGSMYHRVSVMK